MSEILQYVGGVFLLLGALFSALAALGMLRFPDVYTRLHAASKAGALGTGLVFIAIALVSFDFGIIVRALLGLLFILLVSPLAAHILARAALRTKTPIHRGNHISKHRG
jgi:multicomponent Na+:H+ antiporter subunit G